MGRKARDDIGRSNCPGEGLGWLPRPPQPPQPPEVDDLENPCEPKRS